MNPALGALFLGATCIALSPIFVRLSEAGPTATAFWRVALAVPPLWLLLFMQKSQAKRSPSWPLLLAAGFAFAGDLAFWHTSIQLTSVANSTLLANLASLFVTLAAWVFLRQRPSRLFPPACARRSWASASSCTPACGSRRPPWWATRLAWSPRCSMPATSSP
jgi:drug/metabolite transporter (DMT)-like permease